jgi:phosphate transport system substrate-binding protein
LAKPALKLRSKSRRTLPVLVPGGTPGAMAALLRPSSAPAKSFGACAASTSMGLTIMQSGFSVRTPLDAALRRLCAVLVALFCTTAAWADVKISGSETLESLFQNAIGQYARGPGAGVPIAASYKGTGQGLRDLCEGRAQVVPASSAIDSALSLKCEQAKVSFYEMALAFDAVVVIAHPSHKAAGALSMAELKLIFAPDSAGKITRWAQVREGLADTPMDVVSLDLKSGTNVFFGAKVHGLRGFMRHDAKTFSNHADVIKAVAANPNAVGFVSLGALAESKATVWQVPVNFGSGPVAASRDSVLGKTYAPLSRLLYVYVSKAGVNEKDGHTRDFVVWLLDHGARLATYEGFVPLIEQNYKDNVRLLGGK